MALQPVQIVVHGESDTGVVHEIVLALVSEVEKPEEDEGSALAVRRSALSQTVDVAVQFR